MAHWPRVVAALLMVLWCLLSTASAASNHTVALHHRVPSPEATGKSSVVFAGAIAISPSLTATKASDTANLAENNTSVDNSTEAGSGIEEAFSLHRPANVTVSVTAPPASAPANTTVAARHQQESTMVLSSAMIAAAQAVLRGEGLLDPRHVQCVTDADCPKHFACPEQPCTSWHLRLFKDKFSNRLCLACNEVYSSIDDISRCDARAKYITHLEDPMTYLCAPGHDEMCMAGYGCPLGGAPQCDKCESAWLGNEEKVKECLGRPVERTMSDQFLNVEALLDGSHARRSGDGLKPYDGVVDPYNVVCKPNDDSTCPLGYGCDKSARCMLCSKLDRTVLGKKACRDKTRFISQAKPSDVRCKHTRDCPRGYSCKFGAGLCALCDELFTTSLDSDVLRKCKERPASPRALIMPRRAIEARDASGEPEGEASVNMGEVKHEAAAASAAAGGVTDGMGARRTARPRPPPSAVMSVLAANRLLNPSSPLLGAIQSTNNLRRERSNSDLTETLALRARKQTICDDNAPPELDSKVPIFACDPRTVPAGEPCEPCGRVETAGGRKEAHSVCMPPSWEWHWAGVWNDAAITPTVESLGSNADIPDSLWKNEFTIMARVTVKKDPSIDDHGWQTILQIGRECHGLRLGLYKGVWAFSSAYGCEPTDQEALTHWPLLMAGRRGARITDERTYYVAVVARREGSFNNVQLVVDGVVVAHTAIEATEPLRLDTNTHSSWRNAGIGSATVDGSADANEAQVDVWEGSVCALGLWRGAMSLGDVRDVLRSHDARRTRDPCGAPQWSWKGLASVPAGPKSSNAPKWAVPTDMWHSEFTVVATVSVALLPPNPAIPEPFQYAVLRGGCGGFVLGVRGTTFVYGRACDELHEVKTGPTGKAVHARDGQSYLVGVTYDRGMNRTRFYLDGSMVHEAPFSSTQDGFTNMEVTINLGSAGVKLEDGSHRGQWRGEVCDAAIWNRPLSQEVMARSARLHAGSTLSAACGAPKWLWRGPAVSGGMENTVSEGWVLNTNAVESLTPLGDRSVMRGFTVVAKALYRSSDVRMFQVLFSEDGCGGVMVGTWKEQWMIGETCGDYVVFDGPNGAGRPRHNTPYSVAFSCSYEECRLAIDGAVVGSVALGVMQNGKKFDPGWPSHRTLYDRRPPAGVAHVGAWLGPEESVNGVTTGDPTDPGIVQFPWTGIVCSVGVWQGAVSPAVVAAMASDNLEKFRYDACSVPSSYEWMGVAAPAIPGVEAATNDRTRRIRLIDALVPKPPPAIDERPASVPSDLWGGHFTLRFKVRTPLALKGAVPPSCKTAEMKSLPRDQYEWQARGARVCAGPGDCSEYAMTETVLAQGDGCGGVVVGLWRDQWMFGRRCGPIVPIPIPHPHPASTYFVAIAYDASREKARFFVDGHHAGDAVIPLSFGDALETSPDGEVPPLPFHIASLGPQARPGFDSVWLGRVCALSIWKGILPDNAIESDYNIMRLQTYGDSCTPNTPDKEYGA